MIGYQTGMSGYLQEPARQVPVVREVDVLVVGGGTSGCAAAVAAARRGARTALLDRYGFLGGTATAAMVGCLCGVYTCSPNTVTVIRGYLKELTDCLEARGAGYKLKHRYQLDHEVLKLVLDRWLVEAGVELLFQTQMVETVVQGRRVCGVIVESKAGRGAILARVVIDSSGDADVVVRAGGAFEKSPRSELQAPNTTLASFAEAGDVLRPRGETDRSVPPARPDFGHSAEP